MTPTKGFKVLERITICSSADTSQLSTSEHLAPCLTPICCHVPPAHSVTVFLTSLLFLTHARHAPTPHRIFAFFYNENALLHTCSFAYFLSLSSAQVSSIICLHKNAVFPHLLNTPFLHCILCFIFFLAFPTYYTFMCDLLSLPVPPLEQEHFLR